MILGVLLKYFDSRSEGGGGERRAWQKECVASRREVLRLYDMAEGYFCEWGSRTTSCCSGSGVLRVV